VMLVFLFVLTNIFLILLIQVLPFPEAVRPLSLAASEWQFG